MIAIQEIYQVLLFEFPFFKKINEEKRQLLCKRTKHFIEGTTFIGRKEMEVTNRMKILIAACSQQLTLAFPKYYEYEHFHKVIVYPEKYLSTHTQRYHTGEMNTAGAIILSWEDFLKGITIDDNSRNVGLHEFAHALEFMDIANNGIDPTFSACLDKFTALATHYLENQPEKPLFRSYATTNLSEFFAVATEYYFEGAADFVEQEPELFELLRKAYQQDMAPKKQVQHTKKDLEDSANSLFFGQFNRKFNYIKEFICYAILVSFAGYIYFDIESPFMALFLLIVGCSIFRFAFFKNQFSIYQTHIEIHQSLINRLVQLIFRKNTIWKPVVDFNNVLYVSAVEEFINSEDHYRRKVGMQYTLCFIDSNKIKYAKISTSKLDHDEVLLYLFKNKKVGTRLNGNYKKYNTKNPPLYHQQI